MMPFFFFPVPVTCKWNTDNMQRGRYGLDATNYCGIVSRTAPGHLSFFRLELQTLKCICFVCSSILCIAVWGAFRHRVCSVPRLHQSKHLSAAVPLSSLSLWEQLSVHSTGSLRLPLLQTWRQHKFQITSLRMWWVFNFLVALISFVSISKLFLVIHKLCISVSVYCLFSFFSPYMSMQHGFNVVHTEHTV